MSTLVYGASVRGNGHYRTGIECQDSTSFCERDFSNDEIKVVALSDGHGEAICKRALIGSSVATLIAREELYRCVLGLVPLLDELDSLDKIVNNPPSKIAKVGNKDSAELSILKEQISRLKLQISNSLNETKEKITYKWQEGIIKDFSKKPLTILKGEMVRIGKETETTNILAYATRSENSIALARQSLKNGAKERIKENPYIVYGATLLACAQYKEHVFLLKLGDGNLIILDFDGNAIEPLKNKPEEIANATESLCQKNAKELMQGAYLKCHAKIIMMCTDGVSNAFEGDEALSELANGLYESIKNEPEGLRRDFKSFLRRFSEASDDDSTICFIANEIDDCAYQSIKDTCDGDEDDGKLKALYVNEPSYSLNEGKYSFTWENDTLTEINGEKEEIRLLKCNIYNLTCVDGAIEETHEDKKYLILSSNDRTIRLANITEKLYNELIAE